MELVTRMMSPPHADSMHLDPVFPKYSILGVNKYGFRNELPLFFTYLRYKNPGNVWVLTPRVMPLREIEELGSLANTTDIQESIKLCSFILSNGPNQYFSPAYQIIDENQDDIAAVEIDPPYWIKGL